MYYRLCPYIGRRCRRCRRCRRQSVAVRVTILRCLRERLRSILERRTLPEFSTRCRSISAPLFENEVIPSQNQNYTTSDYSSSCRSPSRFRVNGLFLNTLLLQAKILLLVNCAGSRRTCFFKDTIRGTRTFCWNQDQPCKTLDIQLSEYTISSGSDSCPVRATAGDVSTLS